MDYRSISVRNLPKDATEKQIYERFAPYGALKDIEIIKSSNKKLNKIQVGESGVGAYVKFEHELNAREATTHEVCFFILFYFIFLQKY